MCICMCDCSVYGEGVGVPACVCTRGDQRLVWEALPITSICLKLYLFYVYECLPLCNCTSYAQSPQRSEENVRFSGTVVSDSCEPCGCWKPKSSPRAASSLNH